MSGLLRSDFYKLSKLKSFPICLLICVAFSVASIFILDFSNQVLGGPELQFADQIFPAFANNSSLFFCIVISIFAASEFGFGTIKNTASRGFSRSAIYLSKLLVSFVITVVFVLASVLGYGVSAAALWGLGDLPSGFWGNLALLAALQLLLNLAFASVFVMISMLVRQTGGAIAINICVLQFAGTFVSLAQYALQYFFEVEIHLSNYLISGNIALLSGGFPQPEQEVQALVVGVVYLAAAAVLGIWSFRRRDIK